MLSVKFHPSWPTGYRGENVDGRWTTDAGHRAITITHPEHFVHRWAKKQLIFTILSRCSNNWYMDFSWPGKQHNKDRNCFLYAVKQNILLTLSHIYRRFLTTSAVDNFWKHCDKIRNCSKRAISHFATVFSTLFNNSTLLSWDFSHFCKDVFKVVCCCMWERVNWD